MSSEIVDSSCTYRDLEPADASGLPVAMVVGTALVLPLWAAIIYAAIRLWAWLCIVLEQIH